MTPTPQRSYSSFNENNHDLMLELLSTVLIVGQLQIAPGLVETNYAVTEYTLDGPTMVIITEVEDRG